MHRFQLPARALRALAPVVFLSAPLAADGHVRVVDDDPGPGVDHLTIQGAIDGAGQGETILVKSGIYEGFSLGAKDVVITADLGATVQVVTLSHIQDLAPDQAVVLRGLNMSVQAFSEALRIANCEGPVWVEDSVLFGPVSPLKFGSMDAVTVSNSDHVSFHRSHLQGANASSLGAAAGVGLRVSSGSSVYAFDSTIQGGNGVVRGGGIPAWAGDGAILSLSTLYGSGSVFRGGAGADGGTLFFCSDGGDGGTGLVLTDAGSSAQLLDCQTLGGAGGPTAPPCNPGQPGPATEGLGPILVQADPARSIEAPNPVRGGTQLDLTVTGESGDLAFVWVSPTADPVFIDAAGPFLGGPFLPSIFTSLVTVQGPLGASPLQVTFPLLDPACAGFNLFAQAAFLTPGTEIVFSSGQAITVLNSAF